MECRKDFLKDDGTWAMTLVVDSVQKYTLSGGRWHNMRNRTNPNGAYQKDRPTYREARCNFTDFQNFVKWSREQIGYSNFDWHLDKDLLKPNNKVYSRDTCLFIPAQINHFIHNGTTRSKVSELPIGVYWKESINRFTANCRDPFLRKFKHLGTFKTSRDASRAYRTFKHECACILAEKWRDKIDPRAYNALMQYEVEITD